MVESQPSKLLVASSILVSRSRFTGCVDLSRRVEIKGKFHV